MTEQLDDARHVSLANIDTLWDAGNPVVLPIAGSPSCTLDLHPAHGTITLVTPFIPPEPDLAKWRNIRFRSIARDADEAGEITVTVEDNLHAAYGLLTSVADQVQLDGQPLAAALAMAIAKHRDMFAGRVGLSPDHEIGLYGELLVVEHIVGAMGPAAAVASWLGPLSEEHDFVFADVHLEIKTTSGEQRRHVMHGFTQLLPLRGVPLNLVSIQLTRTSSDSGRTLARLVSDVRSLAKGHRPRVDDCLEASGWQDDDASLYTTVWTKRSDHRAYAVDDAFPALTLARLTQAVPRVQSVSDLSYRVDVTPFAHTWLPGPLAGLVESPGDHA